MHNLAWNNIQWLTLADLSHAQCTGMSLSINNYDYTFKFLEFEPILLEFLPIFHGFVLLGDHKLSNSLLEMTLFKKKYHNHVFGTSFHKYCNSWKYVILQKPPTEISIFWDYNKNAHSAKWLKCIIISYFMTSNQDLAKKMGGTYFFYMRKFSIFHWKRCDFSKFELTMKIKW